MSEEEVRAGDVDPSWLNDHSEFQLNAVSGMRNAGGLRLAYRLEHDAEGRPLVVSDWTPHDAHVGFPGMAHGGLIAAVMDDIMGRVAVLRRRWVVTARMEVRYRSAAPLGVPLRFEAWATRHRRMSMHAEARALLGDGTVVAESSGTFLPITPELERQMLKRWPGFAEFLNREL
ncbi:MAG TPA: PaaI family thioesterase [Candidatus Angelobacter sp.]|jgi:acyl-coenzyme A thioesterase PaaI-like protein|nr:PaaI family thioesterase [Candidatus Angelobacter sp.]